MRSFRVDFVCHITYKINHKLSSCLPSAACLFVAAKTNGIPVRVYFAGRKTLLNSRCLWDCKFTSCFILNIIVCCYPTIIFIDNSILAVAWRYGAQERVVPLRVHKWHWTAAAHRTDDEQINYVSWKRERKRIWDRERERGSALYKNHPNANAHHTQSTANDSWHC